MTQYKILGIAGLLIATFTAGYQWNDRAWSKRVAEAESKRIALTLELEREQKHAEDMLLEAVDTMLDEEDVKTEVIYREKIVYRNNPDAGACKLPDEWVQVHDNSTGLPRVSKAPSNAKAKQGQVSDIEVLDVVTANYQMCRKELVKFNGLWDWANSVYNTK